MVSVKAAAGCQLVSVLAVENVTEGSLKVPSRFSSLWPPVFKVVGVKELSK